MPADRLFLLTDDPSASLLLEGPRIAGIGAPCPEGTPRLDCRGARLRPGFVNAHTHLYSGLASLGMPAPEPPPRDFLDILERIWWRLDRALDEKSLTAAARLYVAEALLHGTTTLVDHHESPRLIEGSLDVLADVLDELGIRAVLCYGATERNRGRDEANRGLVECRRFIASNRRPTVRGLVGLHASFTVSDEIIRQAGDLCRDLDVPLHIHVAEDMADVEDAWRRGYRGPLERLTELNSLTPGSILAHGVHLDRQQMGKAALAGLWLVQNPRSNKNNRVGYPRALWASPRVALGTDGYPSDMLEEESRLREDARGHDEIEQKAAALRLDAGQNLVAEPFSERFGALAEGAAADLVAMDDTEAARSRPRHVIVAGRVVVQDGALRTADIGKIRAEAQGEAQRLWEHMKR